jgi:hypothetical protein
MAAEQQGSPGEQSVTAKDVEVAERRANEARRGAAYAGLSAARSIEESARQHEHVAEMATESGTHPESARRHRQAASDDHAMAAQKRKESEADLRSGGAE